MKPNLAYFMTTMIMIAAGVVMVKNHFLWNNFNEGLVSFLCLAFLVKGTLFALFPEPFAKLTDSIVSSGLLYLASAIWIIGGGYLTYIGFYM